MIFVLPYVYGFVQLGVIKGIKPTYELFQKMVCNGNIAGTFRAGQMGRVSSGEIPIAAFNGGVVDVDELKAKGARIDRSDLGGEFRVGTMEYAGVPKNNRSPNLATLATLFLLTPEGQDIYYKHAAYDSPFRKGSRIRKLLPKIDYIETPENVQANPEVYKKLYPDKALPGYG
jgi:ABC-type Fe3+ transport system substrate-binding protein